MNNQDHKDLGDVLEILKSQDQERERLVSDVREIKVCLMGDTSKHDDLGLQGDVAKNTQFRNSAFKVMWLMVAGIVSTAVFTIKGYFGK